MARESKNIAKEMFLVRYNNLQKPAERKELPKKAQFPTLTDFAIDVVSTHFEYYPHLQGIPEQFREKIIAKTNKGLNIKHTALHISDESYWKEACKKRWKLNNLEAHGSSWKQTYLEKTIEELIKSFNDPDEISELVSQMKTARHYVFNLRIPGLLYPVDFKLIMNHLPVLNNLTITFGPRNTGMEYNRQSFGMKMNDAFKLAEGVKNSLNLLSLSLPGNLIDDDLMKILMNGISYNRTLIDLNLSHNRIGNQGARRLAKYIMRNEVLLSLDLTDNQIGYDGSRFLAQALKMNKTLQRLNLKLNNIKDKGGSKFFKDLIENETLIELNMAANTLGVQTAERMADYIADLRCKIQILDVSSNHFTGATYSVIKTSLSKNTSLRDFNVRMNDMLPAQEKELVEIIVKHTLENKNVPFISKTLYEKQEKKDGYDSSEENPKPKEEEAPENKLALSKTTSTKEKKETQA